MQVPTTFQPADMTCVRALYGDRGDGTVSVYNTGTDGKGVLVEICGYAYQPDPETNPGKLAVRQVPQITIMQKNRRVTIKCLDKVA